MITTKNVTIAAVLIAIGVLVAIASVMQAGAQSKAQELRAQSQMSQPDKVRSKLSTDSPWQNVPDEQVRTSAESLCTYARQTSRSEAVDLIATSYQTSSAPTVTAEQARELVGSLLDVYCSDVK